MVLFVDKISDDNKWAYTNDQAKIKYNLSTFGNEFNSWLNELLETSIDGVQKFTCAGKYIVFIKMPKYGTPSMEFDDIDGGDDPLWESRISMKYYEKEGPNFNHIELWNEFYNMKERFGGLFNKDAIELQTTYDF